MYFIVIYNEFNQIIDVQPFSEDCYDEMIGYCDLLKRLRREDSINKDYYHVYHSDFPFIRG